MKILKIWGIMLLVFSAVLFGYGWISGEFSGNGIMNMDNADLLLSIFSLVALLLAITVFTVAWAISETQKK